MKLLMLGALLLSQLCLGQNTLQLAKGQESPKAHLDLVSFMEGRWVGTAFGGETEEIWSPPAAGSMMFVFKHILDGKVNFYEIGHIRKRNNSLVFELKHFGADLKGWEAKDEVQQFPFIKAEGNRVYFEGFTFEKVNESEINIYGRMGNEDGTTSEMVFHYNKA
ncbi:Hypothetical protein I595_1888 [Croceitalea dokdonensis DOKDO 023]|uniref:DUF6265 domain-containing protein n=1 Tax=Croceitalea dokdonensis DOKDO 023 TaxID=1300341 RepID=A0A0P7A690_9FLAO|nr:DUF6265 family protein [Croceitalea dokdonensis]KPM32238.1 Hypothetical protein I595_1888 [Croceitalea dokdonensis DOKDO 023]